MLVYCVVDSELSPTFQLGTSLETFLRREEAERFIEDVRSDDEQLAGASASRSASSTRAGGTSAQGAKGGNDLSTASPEVSGRSRGLGNAFVGS